MNCAEACPKDLNPARAIAEIKKLIVRAAALSGPLASPWRPALRRNSRGSAGTAGVACASWTCCCSATSTRIIRARHAQNAMRSHGYSNCRTRRSSGILSVGTLPQRRRCVMSSPGSDVLTIELPTRLASDRAVVGLLVAAAVGVEVVVARYPDGQAGIGLAAGVLLAAWHSGWVAGPRWSGPPRWTGGAAGNWVWPTGAGWRRSCCRGPGFSGRPSCCVSGAVVLTRSAWLTAWDLPAAELRRLAVRLHGGGSMKPVANFPPSDGSMQTQEPRDAEPRPASGVEQSDLELVRRAQRGERGAFDLLVLRYQHKVVKLVARLLRDPTEAEDVAQEAFVKAYRALGFVPRRQRVLHVAVPDRRQHGPERDGVQAAPAARLRGGPERDASSRPWRRA